MLMNSQARLCINIGTNEREGERHPIGLIDGHRYHTNHQSPRWNPQQTLSQQMSSFFRPTTIPDVPTKGMVQLRG